MKISLTGHTGGVGLALHNYFKKECHEVIGFSRRNGHDISSGVCRSKIIEHSLSSDIFVNNAYNNFDRSQFFLLEGMFNAWKDNRTKLIINISSRWTDDLHPYCTTKKEQDDFCNRVKYMYPKIINLKPGLIDTPRVKSINNNKMPVANIVKIIDFIIQDKPNYTMSSITFGL